MDRFTYLADLAEHLAYPVSAFILVALGAFGLVRAGRRSREFSCGSVAALATWFVVVGYLTLVMHGNGRQLNTVLFNFHGDLAQPALNVLLFVPLGILLATWGSRPLFVVAVGFVLSFGIETTQFLMNDGRTADINDVIMNTLGAALGWLAVFAVSRSALPRVRSIA